MGNDGHEVATAVTTESTRTRAGGQARHPGLILFATGLGLFMIFLDATIVNVALPSIQSDLDVGESGLQWVVAGYSLTMGMFMMTSASLADARGRRRAFVVGLVIFCVASMACGFAPGIAVLASARAVQGVGAAVVNVASLALVGAAYPDPKAKTKAVGLWTGIAAIGLAIGPTLGGVITDTIGWRWIFFVNPLIGGAAIVLTYLFVAESRDPVGHSFDPVGQLLFIVGIGAFTYALVQAPVWGFSSPWIIGPMVLGLASIAVFVRFELRSRDPMMDVRVFRDIPYTAAIVTVFSVLFCAYGTLLVITQYFQNVARLQRHPDRHPPAGLLPAGHGPRAHRRPAGRQHRWTTAHPDGSRLHRGGNRHPRLRRRARARCHRDRAVLRRYGSGALHRSRHRSGHEHHQP